MVSVVAISLVSVWFWFGIFLKMTSLPPTYGPDDGHHQCQHWPILPCRARRPTWQPDRFSGRQRQRWRPQVERLHRLVGGRRQKIHHQLKQSVVVGGQTELVRQCRLQPRQHRQSRVRLADGPSDRQDMGAQSAGSQRTVGIFPI